MNLNFKTYEQMKADGDIPWCRDHLRRKCAAREFPAPVVLSRDPSGRPRRIALVVEEIEAYKARLVAQRDATAARLEPLRRVDADRVEPVEAHPAPRHQAPAK